MELNAGYWLYPFMLEYQWESMPVLLASTSTTYFGNAASTVSTTYTYDNEWAVPVSVSQTDSEGNRVRTAYRYAHSMNSSRGYCHDLADKGILAPVETVTYKNDRVVAAELTEYGSIPITGSSSIVVPVKKYYMPLQSPVASITQVNLNGASIVYDLRYKLAETYEYDGQGNVQNTTTPEGQKTSFVYQKDMSGKNTNVVIAEVSNAVYRTGNFTPGNPPSYINQVYYNGFEGLPLNTSGTPPYIVSPDGTAGLHAKTGESMCNYGSDMVIPLDLYPGDYVLTYWKTYDWGITWEKVIRNITFTMPHGQSVTIPYDAWIDEIRIVPVDARIKTFTYTPDGQISSQTDHNGRTTYREYDHFGRLVRVLDNDRQVLESYEYHTKN